MPLPKDVKIRPWLLYLFFAVVILSLGYLVWQETKNPVALNETTYPTPVKSASVSPKASVSPTSTPTASTITYSNTTYNFTMKLPATWAGYKMKEAHFPGNEVTYYMNVPTTDKSATGDSTADAGFYSPFEISVFTNAQWDAINTDAGTIETLITKNDQYAFAWSHANGNPASDWNKEKDIAGIIASFKLGK